MEKALYLTKREALRAAMVHLMDGDGWISETPATLDDRTEWDYIDRDARGVCWSGETPALRVFTEDGDLVGMFAYLQE